MNSKRRVVVRKAIKVLNDATDILLDVLNEEEDGIENMPENLNNSIKVESMENAADCLSDAIDQIDSAIDSLQNAMA